MNKKQMAAMIDHTILKAVAKRQDVEKLCEEAKNNDFASVCVNPVQAAWCQAIAACRDFISGNPDFDISIIFAIPEEEKLVVGQQVLNG